MFNILKKIAVEDAESSGVDVDVEAVTETTSFEYDLDIDSLDLLTVMEEFKEKVCFHFNREFNAGLTLTLDDLINISRDNSKDNLLTLGKVVDFAYNQYKEQEKKSSPMVLFFMTLKRGGEKLPRKMSRKPADKFVMPQKSMMFNQGKKR